MIGSLQALEAIRLLAGAQAPLVGAFLQVDLATQSSFASRWHGGRRARTAAA